MKLQPSEKTCFLPGCIWAGLLVTSCQLVFGDFEIAMDDLSGKGGSLPSGGQGGSSPKAGTGSGGEDEQCSEGRVRCVLRSLQVCIDGKWSEQAECKTLCDLELQKCIECHAGDYTCDGSKLKTCRPDLQGWTDVKTCQGATPICDATDEKNCVACNTGDLRCTTDGRSLQECNSTHMAFSVRDDCGDYGCVTVNGFDDYCAECTLGEKNCGTKTVDGQEIDYVRSCRSDRRAIQTDCAPDETCDKDTISCVR